LAASGDDPGGDRAGSLADRQRRREGMNLGGAVYAELCDRLMKGHFQPNDRLRIRNLATLLGTSVTPVRDAVLRLVQDRALVMRSQRDIRVPTLTAEEYLEIRDIRVSLEMLSAGKAAREGDDALFDELASLLAANEAAIDEGDFLRATELNQRFHFRLADGARMPLLRLILERLWLQVGPVMAGAYRERGHRTIEEHHTVVEALKNRDGIAAAEAIRHDIMDGGASILERIREMHSASDDGGTARTPARKDRTPSEEG